jgi:hypothetical protein
MGSSWNSSPITIDMLKCFQLDDVFDPYIAQCYSVDAIRKRDVMYMRNQRLIY